MEKSTRGQKIRQHLPWAITLEDARCVVTIARFRSEAEARVLWRSVRAAFPTAATTSRACLTNNGRPARTLVRAQGAPSLS